MTRYRDPSAGTLLGRILHGAPALPGAKCVGRARLFDPPAEREPAADVAFRHRQALALCRVCRALDACGEWFESLPPEERPEGVIAGRVPVFKKRRPRKTAS